MLWRRRLLGAGLLAGAMAFALHVLAPPPPAGVSVLVATRDLPAGTALTGDAAGLDQRPESSLPAGALTAMRPGEVLAAPVRRGEVLTDVRLVGPAALRGLGAGLVAAPVRVADAEAAALLHPGDVVDVLAARPDGDEQARLVASAVRVLSVPRPDDGRLSVGVADGALLLVATTSPTAARLAASAVTDRLSVVLRGS